jgi:hypothetical protein
MKTPLLLASVLYTSFALAQTIDTKKVPSAVLSTFNVQFPKAEKIEWEKEKGNYEASFILNKIEQSALLDSSGKLIETEIEIEKNQLPKNANAYFQSHYSSKKIKEVSKITTVQGVTTYEVEIKGIDLIFDSTGMFLKEINQ